MNQEQGVQTFENAINYWTLSFKDASMESSYMKKKSDKSAISRGIKTLFTMEVLIYIYISITSVVGGAVGISKMSIHSIYTNIILFILIVGLELVFYYVKRLNILKGSVMTCLTYFAIIHSNAAEHSDKMRLPVYSASFLFLNTSLTSINLFYVGNWLVSFVCYMIDYIETLIITFVYYWPSISNNGSTEAILLTMYYIFIFGGFIIVAMFTIRNYEMYKRMNFYSEYQGGNALNNWKEHLEYIGVPIFLAKDDKVIYCNSSAKKLFKDEMNIDANFILEELNKMRQKDCQKMIPSNFFKQAKSIKDTTIYEYIDTKGKIHKLHISYVEKMLALNMIITEYILHDVTLFETMEREKIQRNSFRLLIGSASHELRTPINAIQGVIEILSNKFTNPEMNYEFAIAKLSIEKLELYIKGLVIIQHIETDDLKFFAETFNPNELINKVMGFFTETTKAKQVTFVNLTKSIPELKSDKGKYELILYHLLSNAVRFTRKGNITIESSISDDGSKLHTCIKDSSGVLNEFRKDEISKLFTLNPDVDLCCPHDINMGLFIANELTNFLGGLLNIEPLADSGIITTFDIMIQKEPTANELLHDSNVMNDLTDLNESTGCFKNNISKLQNDADYRVEYKLNNFLPKCNCPKVLIVDDEPFNIFIFEKFLEKIGVTADTAKNGEEAITKIKQRSSINCCKKYNVVFMDINMPVMNGIVAMNCIKNLIESNSIENTPVIAVTAVAQADDPDVVYEYKKYGFEKIRNFMLNVSAKTIKK